MERFGQRMSRATYFRRRIVVTRAAANEPDELMADDPAAYEGAAGSDSNENVGDSNEMETMDWDDIDEVKC